MVSDTGLRIAFAGTPELAAAVLRHVLNSRRHTIIQVFTQPDRPAGRGRHLTPSPVKQLALQHGLAVEQPLRPGEMDPHGLLCNADVLLVAAYGMLLPAGILQRARLGAINVHLSLLPRWRGAAPIQRAIQAGDELTGITIMQMDAGLDTGPILLQQSCPIFPDDTSASLRDRLTPLGAECALRAIELIAAGEITATPQDAALACPARKIDKREAQIDWRSPAVQLARMVRAFNPWPVCHTILGDTHLRLWRAQALATPPPEGFKVPGTLCAFTPAGIDVATGSGMLRLTEIQLPGRKPNMAHDFFNAHRDWVRPGMVAA
ncbi:MAG: methionyl-tRNA formyltransferase [Gammaproteobacteria bacterium RIFCSPLOWO2_02_FULL_61_13]|nr:MAG: methionyl-tRNA formyltransferase [Gammaproteobacteria bacterium RIFCSPLOWO2_02_FULL_61_13]